MKKTLSASLLIHFLFLVSLSCLHGEENVIPLNENERDLLTLARIEIPSHYIAAHEFEGEMASGGKGRLEDFSGKFLLLNFWATWCSPCLREMPDLDEVYKVLGPDRLVVLAVSMGEGIKRVQKFIKKRDYSFPIIADPKMEITRLYGVQKIPITYLIDPSGVIIGRALGPRKWSETGLLEFFRSRLRKQAG